MKRLLIIGLLFLIGNPIYAAWTEQTRDTSGIEITVSTVTTRVRQIIDDPWSTNGTVRYSSDTIQGIIDMGNKSICIQTRALTSWATQQLVAGTTEYALPSDCLYLERTTLNIQDGEGDQYLPQKTVWGMDMDDKTWSIQTSSPTAYYLRNRYIGFFPAPDGSGALVTIWYIKSPATLTSQSDKIFDGMTVMQPYWECLAMFTAAKIALIEGNTNLYSALALDFKNQLEEMASYMKENPTQIPRGVNQ